MRVQAPHFPDVSSILRCADPSTTCLLPERPRSGTPDTLNPEDHQAGGRKQLLQRLLLLALTPNQQHSPTRGGSAAHKSGLAHSVEPEPASRVLATFLRLICIAR